MERKHELHDTMRTKHDTRDYIVICWNCGTSFEATRSDASFCKPSCRVAHSRKKQNAAKQLNRMKTIAEEMYQLSVTYSKNEEIFREMKELEKAIHRAVKNFTS